MLIYFNMGVKRSVRTSGMQPTILDILKIVFRAKKLNILIPDFSFVFFRIFFVYFASLEAAFPGNLEQIKLYRELSILYRNGLSLKANPFSNFQFFWTSLIIACSM